jgi:signal transduction histidine kinase
MSQGPPSAERLEHLEARVHKLAQEKSYLQLVNDLMAKLGAVSGLENTAEALVRLLAETVGGASMALYFWADGLLHTVDVTGAKKTLDQVDDALVARAVEQRHLVVDEHGVGDTHLTEPRVAIAVPSWAQPLLVGEELVGVLRAEGILLGPAEVQNQLGPFFSYAALVLKSEGLSHSRLVEANQKLRQTNERLTQEMAERARQQGFLEALLESLNAVIIACDANGLVTLLNRTSRQLLEAPDGPLLAKDSGRSFNLHRADGRTPLPDDEAPLARALRGERVDHLEAVMVTPGKPVMTLLASGRPIISADGATIGAVVAMQDITDRKHLESQLRHAQKLEAVGQLASGLAHELNTPAQFVGDSLGFLASAFGDVWTVLERYQQAVATLDAPPAALSRALAEAEAEADLPFLAQNVPSAFERVTEGIARISRVVGAMKDFAHPDAKQKSPADLNYALQATLTIARNEYKDIAELETDLGALPPVLCRVGDLNQVFLHLLLNAAHAIADVVGPSGRKGRIRVKTRRLDALVRIDISDTGCGISDDIRERVFEPFFTTKDVGRGSGQGLSIARSIVVGMHGGRLTFESLPGAGTTFSVELPIGTPADEPWGVTA